jgi:hypothetical protein
VVEHLPSNHESLSSNPSTAKKKEKEKQHTITGNLFCQGLEAHTCNTSYSEGRDQADHGLKPAQANSLGNPTLKILTTNQAWQTGSGDRVSV